MQKADDVQAALKSHLTALVRICLPFVSEQPSPQIAGEQKSADDLTPLEVAEAVVEQGLSEVNKNIIEDFNPPVDDKDWLTQKTNPESKDEAKCLAINKKYIWTKITLSLV